MMKSSELADFETALDRFGAELLDWPDAARLQGEALLQRDARARRALASAQLAHAAAASALAVQPPAHLQARVLSHVAARRRRSSWTALLDAVLPRDMLALGSGLAAALLLCGVLFGFSQDQMGTDDEDLVAIATLMEPLDAAEEN
jgi:hypothetical protein